MFWLSAMEPCEAACLMTAMRETFPILRGNKQWAANIETTCAGMSNKERSTIAKKAERVARRIRAELERETGYVNGVLPSGA